MDGSHRRGARFANAALWLAPILLLFCLYADGLRTWFVGDDFYWLGLLHTVHSFHDVVHVLLAPAAQGTIRPWSERGFFLLFESLFGLDSLPFRICVFITMAANLTLVAWITRRITGSGAAGAFAAMLWTVNTALVTVLAWSSAYNEILCSLFLLGALSLLIRYVETGRSAFWWWQVVIFTLGFGALEINVVYPALAAAFALFVAAPERRRRLLTGCAPLFVISIAYFVAHRIAVQFPSNGPYTVRLDGRLFATFAAYLKWSVVPQTWQNLGHSVRSGNAILGIVTLALVAFSVKQLARHRYQILFFAFWYLITMAPMLLLPDHRSDYYLTIPLIGLAMLAGWGMAQALDSRWIWRLATLVPLVAYLSCMIPVTRSASRWWFDRSQAVRGLVLGVKAAEATHPGKTIVLDGVTSDVYNISLADSAATYVGLNEAWLVPTEREMIQPVNDFGRLPHLVMEPVSLERGLARGQVVVYSDAGDHLRNVTGIWKQYLAGVSYGNTEPHRIEAGNPVLGYLLGPAWLPLKNGLREMPSRATARLGGPESASDQLLLEGFCPAPQLRTGVLHLSATVDGIALGSVRICDPERHFHRLFDLPPSLIGKSTVLVEIAVDQTGLEPGLTFGTIAIQ